MAETDRRAAPGGSGPPRLDWSIGCYERTAAQLLPAAEVVVELAAPRAGELVVDVGCGTGNAALLAAARRARVVGVDPALRLLEVARAAAATRELEAKFLPGEAAALPLADGSADAVISVFGVIFAPDAVAAAAELNRVTAHDGRIVLSAWIPGDAISEMIRIAQEAVMGALGAPAAAQPPFAWHEREALEGLFKPHALAVKLDEHRLSFTAASPAHYLDAESEHPQAVAGRTILKQHGFDEGLVWARMLSALQVGNEDPTGFRVTRRYVVATMQRL